MPKQGWCVQDDKGGKASTADTTNNFQQWIALGWSPLDAKYRAKTIGKPDPSNPKHLPNHHRPWKEGGSMAMDPPPAPGASKPGASGTATNLSGPSQPKGGATQHADARARSASPPAHGSAANRIAPGQSQLCLLYTSDAADE